MLKLAEALCHFLNCWQISYHEALPSVLFMPRNRDRVFEKTLIASMSWWGTRGEWSNDTFRLAVLPAAPGDSLEIEVLRGLEAGQPVDVQWNGKSLPTSIAYSGDPLRFDVEATSEPSLLEIRGVAGRPFEPGLIVLTPSDS